MVRLHQIVLIAGVVITQIQDHALLSAIQIRIIYKFLKVAWNNVQEMDIWLTRLLFNAYPIPK